MTRGRAKPDSLSVASRTGATPQGARQQTEGSDLRISGSSRGAGLPEKAGPGCREPALRQVAGPTPPRGTAVIDAAGPSADTDIGRPRAAYECYADVFSHVYADAHSIAIALEVLDTYRAYEVLARPVEQDLPGRVVAIAAALFQVPAKRLFERNRRSDVTSARYVGAWVLRRRRWSYGKIADFFNMDHSTIIHGVRRVATTSHLLLAALKTEHLLEDAAGRILR